MPNILVLSSLLYLLVQMSTSGVCRHRPPSRPSTLSSVIPSSHNVSNSAFVLKLFNPSYSTDLNLRFIPQLKSPKLIVSLTKHLSNSFTSKTHITIRFFPPLTFLVPMNTYFLSLSLSLPPLPGSSILYFFFYAHLRLPHQIPWTHSPPWQPRNVQNFVLCSIHFNPSSFVHSPCHLPFRRGASRAHWP